MGAHNKNILITAILAALVMLPFQNCSNPVEFIDANASMSIEEPVAIDPQPKEEPPSNTEPRTITEEFVSSVNAEKAAVDILWIIDNSGSMRQEAEHVNNNLNSFIETIKDSSDIRFALISGTNKNGNTVTLPNQDLDHLMQINHTVRSHDSLEIIRDKMEQGELKDFFRPNTLKYLVLITDDDSDDNGLEFLDFFKNWYTKSTVKVSGFLGLGWSTSPCQAAKGLEYLNMIEQTGGFSINICEEDWSDSFKKLANDISYSANNVFELQTALASEVLEVSVNGIALPMDLVQVDGNKVTLQFDINLLQENNELRINIKYKTESATSSY